ncbi:uncharacterized protein LOC112680325 [Sipha flava]|uniref:Uncharacterized protein LOC112680325 n=1 Tax=Sipha flava TaxID=143950 RepID=A0A8B8F6C0_9HEMI|nr:uncharacterized protein LOC112680325 [Sipha flava]
MTFPSAVKKSGLTTKPGSGSKTLPPISPRSPGSPLNASSKIITGSIVRAPLAGSTEKISIGTSVKKSLLPPKSPAEKSVTKPVIDAKFEKIATSASKGPTKIAIKPPPLKINIKEADTKELQSLVTTKSIPKTPVTSLVKSPLLAKSPTVSKHTLPSKSPIMPSGVAKLPSSPIAKSSQASIVSSPVLKSPPVVAGSKKILTKSSTSNVSKTSISTSAVSKTSTLKSVASKAIVKVGLTSSKPVLSTDQANVLKPTSPVKKTLVLSPKTVTGVQLPSSPTIKSSMNRSPSTASSVKSISLKTPSPSKSVIKESSSVKTLPVKSITNKSNFISKTGPTSPKTIVKKEHSSLSLLSVKSPTSIKSTISIKSTSSTTIKTKVMPLLTSKSLTPKSPVTKLLPEIEMKTLCSSIIKTPVSPVLKTKTSVSSPTAKPKTSVSAAIKSKTPLSLTVNTTTPLSPIVKTRASSVSSLKSPIVEKNVPTKLILSPGLSKSKSLSSSRLSSVSTESLASRTSLKSPMSPKPSKVITKNSSKAIEIEKPIVKSIRGQSIKKKTIDIPGITELPSISVVDKQKIVGSLCKLENDFNEEIEYPISQIPDQNSQYSEKSLLHNIVSINNNSEIVNNIVNEDVCNLINTHNVDRPSDVKEYNLEAIKEDLIEQSSTRLSRVKNLDEDSESFDFVVVNKDECIPQLNNISHSPNNYGIAFKDNHFVMLKENNIVEQVNEVKSCIVDIDEHFEPMNDKLVLGDVPFETDSSQDDISDNEQTKQKEIFNSENIDLPQKDYVDDVFLFDNFDGADSTDEFIQKFMPKSIQMSEGASSISTDDGSSLSRKSYSEAVSGSFKECEYYLDYDFDVVDDCLDDDDGKSIFVEVTEKEFPELKHRDLSLKRRNKKHKKRNSSNRTEPQSDLNNIISKMNYNPEDFDGNEFCHYINMMKDCSFYPNGLFSSDSVKLSTSSSLSWLDISIRTTDDDLTPSTEYLSTYEIFQASNLNKDFLLSIIGSSVSTTSSNETSWFWKSIEGRHQSNTKANITLSLKPRPKHLTTPRFMVLLALISEAKGYNIQPSLSEHFVTIDCMSRFNEKIKRLMVQGFWFVGRLIQESLSEDEELNCGNPFNFVDGDLGFWWAGVNMLDWLEYMKESSKNQELQNCYQFVVENLNEYRYNSGKAKLSMNSETPEEFMSELDVENFIHTVRNVKYYNDNIFVDSQENFEAMNEIDDERSYYSSDTSDSLPEWKISG